MDRHRLSPFAASCQLFRCPFHSSIVNHGFVPIRWENDESECVLHVVPCSSIYSNYRSAQAKYETQHHAVADVQQCWGVWFYLTSSNSIMHSRPPLVLAISLLPYWYPFSYSHFFSEKWHVLVASHGTFARRPRACRFCSIFETPKSSHFRIKATVL
jgi:hypothetical protein